MKMNKGKILFVLPSFGIGGTTVSTKNIILLLQKKGYECWAMPLRKKGVLFDLYDDVPQFSSPFVVHALSIDSWKDESDVFRKIGAIALRCLCNHSNRLKKFLVGKALDRITDKNCFDAIVACQESITSEMVSFSAHPNKIAWVRCDYNRIFKMRGKESLYESFQGIVCVAEEACDHFKAIYPEYINKTFCIPNPQDSDYLIARSKEADNDMRFIHDKLTLISIGRLHPLKRFEYIPLIAEKLVEKGLDFHWYILGDGSTEALIANSIQKYEMSERVIMLGAKTNPYYYIANSDLLVCLSESEACPRVINEAKILGTPTISTDYPTIYEFIENGINGWISSFDDMVEILYKVMSNYSGMQAVKSELKHFSFNSSPLVSKIEYVLFH